MMEELWTVSLQKFIDKMYGKIQGIKLNSSVVLKKTEGIKHGKI